MLMGLTNTLAVFMQKMSNQIINMLNQRVLALLDNILIYSNIVEEYFKLMNKVFTHLCKHVFYCKSKKCSFLEKTTTFLRFEITLDIMNISDTKVRSLKEWPKPTTI